MADKILIEYEVEINSLKAQMKEVQAQLKATEKAGEDSAKGVGDAFEKAGEQTKSLQAQLKALKRQLAEATDPKEIERLAREAGKLTDQIQDATDAAKVFASESKFEQVGNAIGGVVTKLRQLDFKGAADQSRLLLSATKSITFSEALGGIKSLGTTLLNVGKSLLMNPIFLIGAAVTTIIAKFDDLKNSGGLVGKIFTFIGTAVDGVKNAFLTLTDAIGLTDTAANEAAESIQLAYDKLADAIASKYDRIIKVTKAAGKETIEIEKRKQLELMSINEQQYQAFRDNLIRQGKTFNDLSEEELKKLNEFSQKKADTVAEYYSLYKAQVKAGEAAAAEASKKANEELLKQLKQIRDLEAQLIEDGRKRELQIRLNKNQDEIDAARGNSKLILLIQEQTRRDLLGINEKYDELEKKRSSDALSEMIKKLQTSAQQEVDILEEKDNESTANFKKNESEKRDEAKKTAEVMAEMDARKTEFARATLDFIYNYGNNLDQKRLSDLESNAEKERALLEQQYNQGILSREDYDAAITASKKKEEEESKKIQMAQFKRNQQLALINAAINIAESISKTIAQYPLPAGAPLVALNAALGAFQVATILSQPTPKFAKGGEVGGKLHSQGGTLIEAEKGEYIINRKDTQGNKKMLEAINKGLAEKYIYETYIAPALKMQAKEYESSKSKSFAENIASSMLLSSGKFNDANLLNELRQSRKAERENFQKLTKVLRGQSQSKRNW